MTKGYPIRALMAVFSVLALGGVTAPAAARRSTAASGHQVYASSATCFNWDFSSGQAGVRLLGASHCTAANFVPLAYVVPVHLDTGGTKTVALTIRQTTANTLACALMENDTAGNVVEVIEYDPFPVGSGYVTRSETISIGSTNNLTVYCAFAQSAAGVDGARILSVSY